MNKLKLIKSVVFILTFLIVLGGLLLLTLLFQKTKSAGAPPAERISLNQPEGSAIESIIEKDGQLILLIKEGGISDRIIILNLNTGKKTSQITLN